MNTSRTTRALGLSAGMVLAAAAIPVAVVAFSDRGSAAVAIDNAELAAYDTPLPGPLPPTLIDGPDAGPLGLWSTYLERQLWGMYDSSNLAAGPLSDPSNPEYGVAIADINHLDTLLTHSATTTFSAYPVIGWGVLDDDPWNFSDLTLHEHWIAPLGAELIGIGWADYAGELLPEHLSIGLLGNIDAIMLF